MMLVASAMIYDLLLVVCCWWLLKRLKSDNVVTTARLALLVTFAVSYYISLMWSTVVGGHLRARYCILLESVYRSSSDA